MRPSPETALQAMILQRCVLMLSSCRACVCQSIKTRYCPKNLSGRFITFRTSSSLKHPGTSLLFLNTSRLAPINRCRIPRISRASSLLRTHTNFNIPPPAIASSAPLGSLPDVPRRSNPPPRSECQSSQSSSSNTCAMSSGLRHPLKIAVNLGERILCCFVLQMFSL